MGKVVWPLSATLTGALAVAVGSGHAAEAIDETYVRSLASPGAIVLVMEYRFSQSERVERSGFKIGDAVIVETATTFRLPSGPTIKLWGIEPCDGMMKNSWEGFDGGCSDFGRQQLAVLLRDPRVIFCRAFATEKKLPVQNATCFTHHVLAGAMDSVYMLEEQLVSVGALRLSRDAAGTPLRLDLLEAENIGKSGAYGMWSKEQSAGRNGVPEYSK